MSAFCSTTFSQVTSGKQKVSKVSGEACFCFSCSLAVLRPLEKVQ